MRQAAWSCKSAHLACASVPVVFWLYFQAHGIEAVPGSPAMVLVVWTDDVDKASAELMAAGVPVLQPPHDAGNNNRTALLRDPDGNLVEIVAKTS